MKAIILSLVLMVFILAGCSSNKSSDVNGNEKVTDSIASESYHTNPEQEIQAKKNFLDKFYKEKEGKEDDLLYAYIKKNVTTNCLKKLRDLYDYECDGECLATWVFDYEQGSDIGNIKSRKITPKDENTFLVENIYEYADYSIFLTVINDGSVYKIDEIEQNSSSYSLPEQETDNTNWLQGHWVYERGNYRGHFVIQGNILSMYSTMNPEPLKYTYYIRGNELNAGEMTVKLDYVNQRIDYGEGNWMHKVDY